MNTLDHLVHMVNQIARNFGTLDRDAAAEAVAGHILLYWDPRMKRRIIAAVADEAGSDLSDVAALAVAIVADKAEPAATGA
ncbi:formate dehydrogenase [Sphingopyxis sp. BSNA05]|uniref:formate dehydrogenase subunit delta n=1 Tax=Sphingopyxis sp. BSNA05 TaxID=1236614 RepID=UPI0015663FE2|nr:formate dehydrogenase subunit delta [Sphingopyxis sp. BSNA05]NRD90208.1 formate dehydrogenase [Sphingopyxis sp. BSNA05]